MHVAVTGGAGYAGAVLTAHLLEVGLEVTVVDRLVYGGEALLPFLAHPRCRLVVADVRDRRALEEAFAGAAAVVHLAAVVGEAACALAEAVAEEINVGGTETALEAARRSGAGRFLLVSTCSNYGISEPGEIADEDAPLRPLGLYAETKVAAERAVLGSGSPGACVLRFGTLCGLSPRMRFDLLVNELARAAALGEAIRIFAPLAWRPYLHLRDAARAVERCLTAAAGRIDARVFNVVGENLQKRHLVELVRRHVPQLAVQVEERTPDRRDYRVRDERIRRELAFAATRTVEDAFLEIHQAVASGVFRDPGWSGHSAIPEDPSRWGRRGAAGMGEPT